MNYKKYLKSTKWKTVRKRALKRAGYVCQICNAKKCEPHVHHRTYKNLGAERMMDLVVLCKDCHRLFHGRGEI